MTHVAIPLAGAADAMLAQLAGATGAAAIAALDGATLLGERAAMMGFRIPDRISAGGACRLIAARDADIALNLARPDDRALLPALLCDEDFDVDDDAAIASRIATRDAAALVARGRELGLPIAAVDPTERRGAALATLDAGLRRDTERPPRVLDLSALWAGPLAAHLLWLAGAEVIKVESPARPDAMRDGQPDFHALLNQGKASVALDLRDDAGRAVLLALIEGADIVIEAARPRALRQLGVDADAIVARRTGLSWISITAHGHAGEAADWVGFGDDCGIAAGLGAAMAVATGRAGFVGDAIADPLTGIHAACMAWQGWRSGRSARTGIAMCDVVGACVDRQVAEDAVGFDAALRDWAAAAGTPFPAVCRRHAAPARPFGIDLPHWQTRC